MRNYGDLHRPILLGIILAGFALRLHELTLQNIWWDEARNIDVALRPFLQIPTAPELDIHPPIYFWLLHLWARLLGLGDSTQVNVAALATPTQLTFIVRSLSVFANMLSVVLLVALLRLWTGNFTRQITLIVASIAAFSPFWLAESQETRMYTLSFTLLLVAAVALMHGLAQLANSRRDFLTFALFSALALLTHYNALFIVVAWYLWWGAWAILQTDRWLWLRRITGYGLLMSAVVLPITSIALRQIPGYSNPNLTVPTIPDYLIANWQVYFGGFAYSSDWFQWGSQRFDTTWFWLIGIIAVVGLLLQYWAHHRASTLTSQSRYLSFLLVWLIGGLALYYIAVIDRGAFNPRYSSLVTPALYGLVAIGLVGWTRFGSAATAIGIALLAIGFVPGIAADLYDDQFAREDMQQTVEWLKENTNPDDIIFVDQKYPFGFYYDRFVIDADHQYPEGAKTPARYLFVDINTIDARLNEWAGNAERIFWLQWYESDTDPRNSVTFLLDQKGIRSGEKHFRGYTVDWWTMEPPTRFELAPNMEAATYIFPPAVETVAFSLPDSPIQQGARLPVAIRWKRVTEGQTVRPLKVRIGLYRPGEDSRVGQDDRPLLNDRHLMPSEWSKEDQPLNVYAVPIATDLPSGTYEVRILVYDEESLEPLTYVDLAGNPAGVEAVIGNIEVAE